MEIDKVYVSSNIKKVLSLTDKEAGYVAGWNTETEKFCLAVSGSSAYFIAGLKVNGIFCFTNDVPSADSEYLRLCESHHVNLGVDLEDLVVLFVTKSDTDEEGVKIIAKCYSPYFNTLKDVQVQTSYSVSPVLLRARGELPCYFEVVSDSEILKENINQAIEKLRTLFQKETAAFLKQNVLIQNCSSEELADSKKTLKQLLKSLPEDDSVEKSKFRKAAKKKIPTEFDILIHVTGENAIDNSFNHSMVIHCQRREFQCATVHIPLDVLVVCEESCSPSSVYKLFINAIEQQLIQINKCLIKYTKYNEIDTPTPYHFYPDLWDFPITIIYPLNKSDKELESYRAELHKELLLPMDRPFLKKLNVHEFSTKSSSGHLYNPHEGLNTTSVAGGKSAVVYGTYSYHHYMQDHMDDNGWGCAYRSLQTIISWFRHQGYTDKSVPTHEEIQKALVAVGDKPESFIGSKKWIGSQEVSFCLDHLINVQCKIMFVSSGAEMANKGRELYNHFRDQGTPVMIGGGVLAHTILGVDFNQDTGELKFLILDPHYTGKEDLSIILSKGWCGWKDVKFWDQNAFYNLCLPQRLTEL